MQSQTDDNPYPYAVSSVLVYFYIYLSIYLYYKYLSCTDVKCTFFQQKKVLKVDGKSNTNSLQALIAYNCSYVNYF